MHGAPAMNAAHQPAWRRRVRPRRLVRGTAHRVGGPVGSGGHRWLGALLGLVLVLAGVVVVPTVVAPAAAAAGTGTGGSFVPVGSRLVDTRNGTGGYSTPQPASGWRPYPVTGVGSIPTTGVASW